MVPVEIRFPILFGGIVSGQERRIPTVAAEYFVSALAALDDLDPL